MKRLILNTAESDLTILLENNNKLFFSVLNSAAHHNETMLPAIDELLKKHNYSYVEGKTWTIDTPYRETRNKVLKRKEQGCISVEMESSAMSAVSKFRDKDFFTFFYAADNLDASKWDKRSLDNEDKISEKDKILLLALELGLKVYQKEKEREKTK